MTKTMRYALFIGTIFGLPIIVISINAMLGYKMSLQEAQGSYALFLLAWDKFLGDK